MVVYLMLVTSLFECLNLNTAAGCDTNSKGVAGAPDSGAAGGGPIGLEPPGGFLSIFRRFFQKVLAWPMAPC